MFRLILLFIIPLCFVKAEDVSTARYELSPFTVDLIHNWDDISQFPYSRHFFWELQNYDFNNFNQGTMTKKFSNVKEDDLRSSIEKVLKSLGTDKKTHFQLRRNELRSRRTGDFLITGFNLNLTTTEKVHTFFYWINNYFTNVSDNPFSQRIETPVISAKYTILSLPVELARKKGLDFFPSVSGSPKAPMKNADFQKFIKLLTKEKEVSVVAEYLCRAVSGKTMVIRDVEEYHYPEVYDFYGELSPSREFDEKTQKWKAASQWAKVYGIQPMLGESRDVGNNIEMTPQVEPDGRTVSLDLKLNLLKHLGWTQYNVVEDIRMPALQSFSTETRMTSLIGETRPVSIFYDSSRKSNIQNSVRKEDLVNKSLDKCLIIYVSLDSQKDQIKYDKDDGDWSFYMTPVGSLAKAAFQNLVRKNDKIEVKVKSLLSDMGMKFPQGSFFHYDSEFSVVCTFNKASEIKKLISFLPKEPNPQQKNIYYESNNLYTSNIVLDISTEFADEIGLKNKSDLMRLPVLRKLLKGPFDGKKALIRSISTVVTQNGNTSVNRDVIEVYVPESFDYQKSGDKTLALPNFGDPRDIGHVLEVTSQIDLDYKNIETEIKVQSVDISAWLNLRNQKSSAVLKSYSLDTRLKGVIGRPYINSYEVKNNRVIIDLANSQLDFLEREQP